MGIFDGLRGVVSNIVDKDIPFEDVKDDFQFTGFSDAQKDVILGQLEQVWGTDSGQDMLQAGLNGDGLHYLNMNSQGVMETVAPAIGYSVGDVGGIGNFALPNRGEIYLNSYDAIDPATGAVYVYTNPALTGQTANAKDPITSLNEDGTVFTVPPIYTLIHETSHTAHKVSDLSNTNPFGGKYYSGATINSTSVDADYIGPNETLTRAVLEELGITDFRGAYTASTALDDSAPGTEFGLGRNHDVAVTTYSNINMSTHAPVDAVIVGARLAELQALNPSFTMSQAGNTFRMGDGNDTVHMFDGNDTVIGGRGNDMAFGGFGNDRFIGGRGFDVYDGGDANLDPASNHRSNSNVNWGIDAVDYTSLDVGGGSAGLLGANFTFDGVARDGILIQIDGNEALAHKGAETLGDNTQQVDQLNNIDIITGTGRADLTEVQALSGERLIDGGASIDTLSFPDTLTNVTSAGTFNGIAYDGYLEANGAKLYYTNYEKIIVQSDKVINTAETSSSTTQDIEFKVSGSEALQSSRLVPLDMREAITILRDQGAEVAQEESAAGEMMRSAGAQAMVQTLVGNGETEISVFPERMGGASSERVGEILRSIGERLEARGLTESAAKAVAEIEQERLGINADLQNNEAWMQDDYDVAL